MRLPDNETVSRDQVHNELEQIIFKSEFNESELLTKLTDLSPEVADETAAYIKSPEVASPAEKRRHLERALITQAIDTVMSPRRLGFSTLELSEQKPSSLANVVSLNTSRPDTYPHPPPRLARVP